MKDIPQKIYLQLGMEDDYENDVESFKEFTEVSWCSDRMHTSDIEYHLASPLPSNEDELARALLMIEIINCFSGNQDTKELEFNIKSKFHITRKQTP